MKTVVRKSIAATLVAPFVVGAGLMRAPEAQAGDEEWATVGKILTGVVAAHVLIDALPVHHERRVVVHETRVVHRPVIHHRTVIHRPPRYQRFGRFRSLRRHGWRRGHGRSDCDVTIVIRDDDYGRYGRGRCRDHRDDNYRGRRHHR